MPRDGSGTYTRTDGVVSGNNVMQQQRDTIGTVDAPRHDAHDNDVAQALTDSVAKDGQTVLTGDLPMGGNKLTNLANGTARNQAAAIGQVQDGQINYAIATGTGDAMVANFTPAITSVQDGQQFRVRAVGANTIGTPTFQVGGTTARVIVKAGGGTLQAGDYVADMEILLRYKNLATPVYEILNPLTQVDTSGFVPTTRQVNSGTGLTGGGDLSADRTLSIANNGVDTPQIADGAVTNAKLATAPVLSAYYKSPEQTITAGGQVTLTHGLGAVPKLVQLTLICKTAEGGYSINDEVSQYIGNEMSGLNAGCQLVRNSTQLVIRFGTRANTYVLLNKTTGTNFNATNGNWRAVFEAFA